MAIAVGERQRAPADDIELRRGATLDWTADVTANLIVIYKNLKKIIIILLKRVNLSNNNFNKTLTS